MSTSRPFSYNTGSTITGTEQVGNLAVGTPTDGFSSTGLKWWNGPDEDLGYVIAHQTPSGQPGADGDTAYLGFFRSDDLTDNSFLSLTETISNQTFNNTVDAKTWLNNNGYWTSYEVSDQLEAQLTTSLASYQAASDNTWVKITKTEYDRIAANIVGATKKGNTDVDVNKRDVGTGYANSWIAFGTDSTPSFQINSGEYVIAMITEAWNQSGGNSQLGYTTSFKGSGITNIGGTAGPSTGGGRDYFVFKAPTIVANATWYPTLKMSVTPNTVFGWNGFNSSDNGSTWTVNISSGGQQVTTSKIQLITTSTKSW